ncbi:MAG: tetratricopeptide repeat protein [Acidimicrobiales bacterium]
MTALDVTDATFEADVLERSDTVPVVVDLWAPWCGPCRTLGPIIEQVVDATEGAAALAKVNVDENPRVSATFQVQSIPAVFAIHKRQVIDRFIGALPERDVKEFVDRVLERAQPTETELLLAAGDEVSLRKALELEPANEQVIVSLASLLVERGGTGDPEEALTLLERMPETAETRRIAALARTAERSLTTNGPELEQELDALLARLPGDDEARQEIVDLLETMDPEDPLRAQYRRALSAKLF